MEALIFWSSLTPQSANGEFIDKIQYEPHEPGDVLMLTGVGEVFPVYENPYVTGSLATVFFGCSDFGYVSG